MPEITWKEIRASEIVSLSSGVIGQRAALQIVNAIIEQAKQEERERLLRWLGSGEAIEVAVKRQILTNEAVGIAGLPKPTLENAMGAVLVAVANAAPNHLDQQQKGNGDA